MRVYKKIACPECKKENTVSFEIGSYADGTIYISSVTHECEQCKYEISVYHDIDVVIE